MSKASIRSSDLDSPARFCRNSERPGVLCKMARTSAIVVLCLGVLLLATTSEGKNEAFQRLSTALQKVMFACR